MNRVRMLTHFGVTPYLVFDGGMLPSKALTEESRAARREESKKAGLRLYQSGRVSLAQQELQKAVDVTPYMARLLIEELKKCKIQYVVAPYEADAQLVYLEKKGIINGIISEDSDMLVFGAKRLLSKLDQYGECVELNRNDFTSCRDISLIGWSDENFRQMCILSGCDYLASIPGMGLKTAYRYMRKCKSAERAVKLLQFEGKSRVPPTYLDDFKRAEQTFLYQLVFCPTAAKLVPLSPLPPGMKIEDMPFAGQDVDPEVAVGIACGDLDPISKEPIEIKKSSYPERARMVLSRRQTLPSVTEKKPTQRITSFYTPKRIPLGELDPNSLTPSPSQQRVLENNARRSWQATPAPAVTGSSSIVSSMSTPRIQAERRDFLARSAAISRPPPVKRQRLCSDADDTVQFARATDTTSPFFAATPSAKPVLKTQIKKARRADFGVFSDDSVEDIMLQLPETVCTPGTEAATIDSELETSKEAERLEDAPVGTTLGLTDGSVQYEVQNQDSAADDSETNASITDHDVRDPIEPRLPTLRDRFGYGSTDSNVSPFMKPNPRPTPLQRLGLAALTRSKSLNSLPVTRTHSSTQDSGYDSDHAITRLFARPKGSEDLIVPDSQDEEEHEDCDNDSDAPDGKTTLDLKKFMFSPVQG